MNALPQKIHENFGCVSGVQDDISPIQRSACERSEPAARNARRGELKGEPKRPPPAGDRASLKAAPGAKNTRVLLGTG